MSTVLWAVIACGVIAVLYGVVPASRVMAADAGTPRMQEIAQAIQEGAGAYLRRQYTTIAIVGVIVLIVLFALLGKFAAGGFLIGAVLSGAVGFIGMNVSVRANVRTAVAAQKSLGQGLDLAFKSGAITGMLLAGLALLGVLGYYAVLRKYFEKLGDDGKVMWAVYQGVIVAAVLSIPAIWLVTDHIVGMATVLKVGDKSFTGMSLFWCSLVGLAITGLIVWITEYYTGTDYRPVKAVAQASVTGHGTNVIAGLAMSMEATALPALLICCGIVICYVLAGLFGIAIATTAMLALAGMVVALDAYGPVTDNAGGIAEMAGLPKEGGKYTAALDAVGNTTKAVTKGYA